MLRRRAAVPLAAAFLAGVALLHAALIAGGRWRADEYFNAAMLDGGGLPYLLVRLRGWSPRPLSEAFAYLYWRAIRATGAPLSGPLLAAMWLILLASLLAAMSPPRLAPRALICVAALLASFLLGHPIAEMFYWPMGALAYLPALAGVAFVILRTMQGGLATLGGRLSIAGGLIVAATSAEVGAMFTFSCAAAFTVAELTAKPRRAGLLRRFAVWLLPLAVALAVFWLAATGRVAKSVEHFADGATYHHAWASLGAAFGQIASALVPAPVWRHALTWLLLFLGLRGCLPRPAAASPDAWRWQWACAAGLLGAIFLSCAAADFQFGGMVCCERLDSFRQCLAILLAVVAAAAASAPAVIPGRPPITAALLLTAAIALPLIPRIPALATAYAVLGPNRHIWHQTWRAGRATGADMIIRNGAPDPVTGDNALPPGTYRAGQSPPWYANGRLLFFHKSSMTVLPADAT